MKGFARYVLFVFLLPLAIPAAGQGHRAAPKASPNSQEETKPAQKDSLAPAKPGPVAIPQQASFKEPLRKRKSVVVVPAPTPPPGPDPIPPKVPK